MACATTPTPSLPAESTALAIDDFLEHERAKDLLRFSTAGSVDDGKSTLIGRLLYDTQSVYDDQVRAIRGKGTTGPQLDFALLTDGLRAEREQGITIDVAYRYFSTARRKFIIADTPGHEQYTRNMATGASTSDAAIVLVDARKGVLVQSRRHAYIAALLGVQHIIVAVNKMDLVDYSEATFVSIRSEFARFMAGVSMEIDSLPEIHFIPVSALLGVNVAHRSQEASWYRGPSLLELLESVHTTEHNVHAHFRLPIQHVLRPDQNFRGFAGRLASGCIRVGDNVTALPSRVRSRVKRIVTYDGDLSAAHAPLSVTLTLEDELDISRGDVLFHTGEEATEARSFEAALVWMDARPLDGSRRYLLKHTNRTVAASARLQRRVQLEGAKNDGSTSLEMNGIGIVELKTATPIALERYADNRTMGAFVLIDPDTNATVAAGMVRGLLSSNAKFGNASAVTAEERARQWGHRGAVLRLAGPAAVANALERALFEQGAFVVHPRVFDPESAALLEAAGVLVLVSEDSNGNAISLRIGETPVHSFAFGETETSTQEMLNALRRANVLYREDAR